MSKLVYKSINEIINKKFIRNESLKDTVRGVDNIDQKDITGQLDKRSNADVEKYNRGQKTQNMLKRKILQTELQKTNKEIQGNQTGSTQLQDNFDAQAVPGAPPVGMPPTAAPTPPPAPMPKPAAGPNYEGGHMTKTQLCQAHEACSNMMASIEDYDSLPDWLKGKITLAADYLVKCESFVNAKDQEHEDSQDEHMPKAPTPPAPAPSPMKPSTGGGTPMMGISLGRVQSVSPGE